MSPDPDQDGNVRFDPDRPRTREIMQMSFLGELAFHGSLAMCVLVSLYLRIIGL